MRRRRSNYEPGLVQIGWFKLASCHLDAGSRNRFMDGRSHHEHLRADGLQLTQFSSGHVAAAYQHNAPAGQGHKKRKQFSHNKKARKAVSLPGLLFQKILETD
jgi:hypothetical protein